MVNWVDGSTFNKLNIIDRQYFYNDELNPNWINQELDYAQFQGLYEYFFNGAEIMHRANANGKLELLILINDIDPIILAKSKLGIKVVENENNRFIFHLLIWDNEDSPLEVPFIFQLKDSVQRYHIAAFCEQESIPIYFFKRENKTLYVSFSREMFLPDQIRTTCGKRCC